jgi:valyl-tRNA synthetase
VQDEKIQKILGNNKAALINLGRIEDMQIGEAGSLARCAVAPVNVKETSVQVIIPLEGLVDFNEEIKRIQKQIEKLQKDISLLTGKLSNEKFIANAEEDVIQADRLLLEQV